MKNKLLIPNTNHTGSKRKNWGSVAVALLTALLLVAPLVKNQIQHPMPIYAEGDDRPKLGAGG